MILRLHDGLVPASQTDSNAMAVKCLVYKCLRSNCNSVKTQIMVKKASFLN